MRYLLCLLSLSLPAATLSVTNNSALWNSWVTGAVTDDFNTSSFSGSQFGPPWLTRNNITYSIDRTTDSASYIGLHGAGVYQPTGVMSVEGTLNGELTNIVITPATPTTAIALNHTTWRHNGFTYQMSFAVSFADGTTYSFVTDSAGETVAVQSGSAPPAYTGFLSDVLITSLRMESTIIPNDIFARGITIDNVTLASSLLPLANPTGTPGGFQVTTDTPEPLSFALVLAGLAACGRRILTA